MIKLEQAARQAFEMWWEREGQEFLFALNTTTDDDIKLVAEIAWKNGAYCAERAKQERMPITEPVVPWLSHKVAEQAEQEPVATIGNWGKVEWAEGVFPKMGAKLYAAPVRTKDLTDDEIDALVDSACDSQMPMDMFARAVIAADREKNNGC